MEKQVNAVLAGQTTNLPAVHSQIVRIFTSSTFTDTYLERNLLMKDVYPKLKEYCRNKHALDFQVVDMRWGVRDDASDDHMTTALCMEEIQNCQQVSVGPNFVTFLCQRYGFRPIPASIPAEEFERMSEALWKGDDGRKLMETWYRKDSNALPPVYVLQKISSILPGYISDKQEERASAREEWRATFVELQASLRHAAKECLDEHQQRKYFMSVTEDEVRNGMLLQKDVDEHCTCFIRVIDDLEENLHHERAWRFIDMSGRQLDRDAQAHLTQLRDSLVPARLADDNIFRSRVTWSAEEDGIGSSAHAQYLESFAENFYTAIVRQVDRAVLHRDRLGQNELFLEALQHLKLAKDRCEIFHGREDLLDKLQTILSRVTRQPIVVHGQSGCGKTSIMAMASQNVRQWLPSSKNAVVIVRFLGTTPQSSGIMSLLTSICLQIAHNYKTTFTPSDVISTLVQSLSEMLKCASAKKPLLILLDSLDQLSSGNYAHKLSWLPWQLPDHVHVIVSTLPEMYSILPTLRKRIQEANFVRVQSLGDRLGMTILSSWLERANRTLTPAQHDFVVATLKKCSLPLYTRLLYENVMLWKSYTEVTEVPHTIRGIITALFERLEKSHGHVFVNHALGYITASKSGLSETELEDVLSLDDQVLTDVFQYHIPPVRRIPQLLIVRLRHAIAHYVVNREADGVMVMYWYHRQFIEAARDRYMSTSDVTQFLHATLADYFLGTWYMRKKEFHYTAAMAKKLALKNTLSAEDRRVPNQPLWYGSRDDKNYNRRKLSNLPHHLQQANMAEELLTECLLNYDWLKTKIEAFSLQETLADFELNESSSLCKLLCQSLSLARSTLRQHADTLGIEIIARMLNASGKQAEQKIFNRLLNECIVKGAKQNALLPKQQIFNEIDERLKFELEHSKLPANWRAVCMSPDGKTLYARLHPNELAVWDLKSGEIEKQVSLWPTEDPKLDVMRISYASDSSDQSEALLEARYAIFGSSYKHDQNPIVVVDLKTSEIKYSVNISSDIPWVAFAEQLQFSLYRDCVVINAAGSHCGVYSLVSAECRHRFECKPTIMKTWEHKLLVYVKGDECMQVYSLATWELKNTIHLLNSTAKKILISNDGAFVLYKNAKTIEMWDLDKPGGKILANLDFSNEIKNNNIFDVEISSDHRFLLVCHKSGVLVWNIKAYKLVKHCKIPGKCVPKYHRVVDFKSCLSPDNRHVISAYEGYVIVWAINSNEVAFYKVSNDTNRLLEVIPSPDPEHQILVAVIDNVRAFKVLDLQKVFENRKKKSEIETRMDSGVRYVVSAYSSSKIVCRSHNSREVAIFDTATGKKVLTDFQTKEVMQPEISLDGRYVLLNAYNPRPSKLDPGGPLRVYSTETGKMTTALPVNSTLLRTYTFSHSGDLVVTHCEETVDTELELALWKSNSKTPHKVKVIDVGKGGVSAIECVYDDRYVITLHNYSQLQMGDEVCDVRVFSVETGCLLHHSTGYARSTLRSILRKPYFFVSKMGTKPNFTRPCMFDLNSMQPQEKSFEQYGWLRYDREGLRCVDSALQVFDVIHGTLLASFGDTHTLRIPKISQDGRYIVWFSSHESRVFAACVDTRSIIGHAFIHSTPLSIKLCINDVLAVGCEEGYVMLFDIVDNESKIEKARKSLLKARGMGRQARPREQTSSALCTLI